MTEGPLLFSPVVSTQWLADHLGSDNLAILDATAVEEDGCWQSRRDRYLLDGHIPGAVFADVVGRFSAPGAARPGADEFAAAAASVGVDDESTIIVYDAVAGSGAARLWWLFHTFGSDRIAVLDGDLGRWRAESREVQTGDVVPVRGRYTTDERPSLWHDRRLVENVSPITTAAEATPRRS